MKRGEIYYIQRRDTVGAEIRKARPGVIVSRDSLNATSDVVSVVYLTTQPKEEQPTHAVIHATGLQSVALCEQIDSVDKSLVGDYCGECSPDELRAIEEALCHALGLFMHDRTEMLTAEIRGLREALAAVTSQRDRYEKIIDILSVAVEL